QRALARLVQLAEPPQQAGFGTSVSNRAPKYRIFRLFRRKLLRRHVLGTAGTSIRSSRYDDRSDLDAHRGHVSNSVANGAGWKTWSRPGSPG
ncbi:MAG: hypothetical protein AAB225_14390, partial [Acidobacteriota bacterium]